MSRSFYARRLGIEGIDLVIERGARTGLLGANGAGKTTLLRVLVGVLRATRGDARLFAIPAGQPGARSRVGFIPADPAFHPSLTGFENLHLLARLQGAGAPDRSWASERLELGDADLQRPVATYSSGMRQKLVIVQTVQRRPDLVIMDEPANRLDPVAHHSFEDLVRRAAVMGAAALAAAELRARHRSILALCGGTFVFLLAVAGTYTALGGAAGLARNFGARPPAFFSAFAGTRDANIFTAPNYVAFGFAHPLFLVLTLTVGISPRDCFGGGRHRDRPR